MYNQVSINYKNSNHNNSDNMAEDIGGNIYAHVENGEEVMVIYVNTHDSKFFLKI